MGLIVIRMFFFIFALITGYYVAPPGMGVPGALFGLAGAGTIILMEVIMERVPARRVFLATIGLITGLIAARLLFEMILLIPPRIEIQYYVRFFLYYLFSYLGVTIALRYTGKWNLLAGLGDETEKIPPLLLDSNVIIDGRLLDLSHTGFMDYRLIVPGFIIKELQTIADSSDDIKRQRGRRGLEMLNRMRRDPEVKIIIDDIDFPNIAGVDAKLIQLARTSQSRILTNDYNLAKIAEVQNIKVLNLNSLSTVLKPRYVQDEHILIKIIKEGKESDQGIGYLEDGTMVVVEGGRKHIGESMEVVIANTIQTATGRMLFAELP
ncbi:MAG: hypothetical protein NTY10_03990 [Candidatus Omnitrophica bacterium]|nr:hypothetical protein [Candidatus Omnitrophota bacterium]